MTRRVDPKWLLVAGGLALMLTGCATHGTTGAGVEAASAGGSAQDAHARAASGVGQTGDAARGSAAVQAPGATLFPTLPSPQEFSDVAALRDIHFDFDRASL